MPRRLGTSETARGELVPALCVLRRRAGCPPGTLLKKVWTSDGREQRRSADGGGGAGAAGCGGALQALVRKRGDGDFPDHVGWTLPGGEHGAREDLWV